MKPVAVSAHIAADPDRVYEAIVDIERLPETSADTVAVAFVGEQRSGPGTRFRETRRAGKRTQAFELELAECDASSRTARFVSDMHETVWDTRMRVVPADGGAHVEFTMEAHTGSRLKRFVFTMMRGVFRKAMNEQVASLKQYCERA
jgi:hypothetical protein